MSNAYSEILKFFQDLFQLKYLPNLKTGAGFGLIFIFGILTSFHCIAMCGGIAISQAVKNVKETKLRNVFLPSLAYNLGRIVSYTIIGGIVGGIGHLINLPGILKGIIPIIGGIFMIIMGINLTGLVPSLRKLNIRMPLFAAKHLTNGKSHKPFLIGLLSGLMPCGPLQIIQLYALGTGSILLGASSAFIFAIGTVPVMFAFSVINSVINRNHTKVILKFSAVLVIILGFGMLQRGLMLSGISLNIFSSDSNACMNNMIKIKNEDTGIAKLKGNVQTVTTEIKKNSFPEIVVQKGIAVKWTIKVSSDNLNACNNVININEYKLQKKFHVGNNLIEFTPQKSGQIPYTCWMAMIKSKIIVVDDIRQVYKK